MKDGSFFFFITYVFDVVGRLLCVCAFAPHRSKMLCECVFVGTTQLSLINDIFIKLFAKRGLLTSHAAPDLSAAALSAWLHARWSTFEAPFDLADEASVTAAVRRECK